MNPAGERCTTCADEAVVARVVELRGGDALVVGADGREQRVAVDLLEGVTVGDRLLCHAGIALERAGDAR